MSVPDAPSGMPCRHLDEEVQAPLCPNAGGDIARSPWRSPWGA